MSWEVPVLSVISGMKDKPDEDRTKLTHVSTESFRMLQKETSDLCNCFPILAAERIVIVTLWR